MLTNRPEFHFVDSAALHLGATPFSIYNTYTAEQIEYLVGDAGAKILVTEKAFLETILAVRSAVPAIEHVIVVDGDGSDDTLTLAGVEEKGDPGFDFEAAWRAVGPDDLLTLIYTSGTTGPPKGVQLTHDNIVYAIGQIEEMIDFPRGGRVISWLPYAHIAERACSHYLPIILGFTTTDCPDPRQVVAYLPEVRPSWFFAVPRIWEKLKAAIEMGIEHEQDADRKAAVKGAIALGLEKVELEQAGEGDPRRPRRALRAGRRAGALEDPRAPRARPWPTPSTSAPRRPRPRSSSSSTRSAFRWPSCGACPRPAAPAA